MCGIAGIVNFDERPVRTENIHFMNTALKHRGPDGDGVWVEGKVGFGHTRLAIRDLSDAGLQPVFDKKRKLLLTYNGEIYNDAEIKTKLLKLGVEFTSTCDTEVIIPAYEQWGMKMMHHFHGMFALALWDFKNERLILIRDAVGIKPLFYTSIGNSIRFASELKALKALGDQPDTPNQEGWLEYLCQGYTSPDKTLNENIKQVPPGCVLTATKDGINIEQWWRPNRTGEIKNLESAAEEFNDLWPKVLSDHLISDVPVGLLLSAGIDSSLIAADLQKGTNTYTAAFGEKAFDESSAAALTSKTFGHEHTVISVDATSKDVENRFRQFVHFSDGQLSDASSLAFYSVCKSAKQHRMPVLLTGDGADEFFGGYETYYSTLFANYIGSLIPKGLSSKIGTSFLTAGANTKNRVGMRQKLGRLFLGLAQSKDAAHATWRRYIFDGQLQQILGQDLTNCLENLGHPTKTYVEAFQNASGTAMDKGLVADQTYYLPGDMLVKSDRMSMAHSIEVRVPFLDRRIMEFANKLDLNLILPKTGPTKKFLRTQLSQRGMPKLSKQAKKGFNVPVSSYLRGPLRALGEELLNKNPDILSPLLTPDGIRDLWREHQDRRADNGYILWTLLVLAMSRET